MKEITLRVIGVLLDLLCLVSPKKGAELGYRIMCRPIRTNLKAHQVQFLNTSEKIDLVFEGLKMQAYKWGSGKTKILLVHGWSSNSFRWKKLVERLLKENCTIFAFDAPAHGYSEGNMLHLEIFERSISKFEEKFGPFESIISHSIGCFATLYSIYKNDHPMLINAVLLASPAKAKDFFDHYKKTLSLNNSSLQKIKNYFEIQLKNRVEFYDIKNFAQKIELPILLIHDKHDEDTLSQNTEELSKILKNNQLIITEGLGHHLRSEELNEEIVRFVFNN